jgi:hypothetical protein
MKRLSSMRYFAAVAFVLYRPLLLLQNKQQPFLFNAKKR